MAGQFSSLGPGVGLLLRAPEALQTVSGAVTLGLEAADALGAGDVARKVVKAAGVLGLAECTKVDEKLYPYTISGVPTCLKNIKQDGFITLVVGAAFLVLGMLWWGISAMCINSDDGIRYKKRLDDCRKIAYSGILVGAILVVVGGSIFGTYAKYNDYYTEYPCRPDNSGSDNTSDEKNTLVIITDPSSNKTNKTQCRCEKQCDNEPICQVGNKIRCRVLP